MLQLLDINKFIADNKLKEVKNSKISNLGFDPESLWSSSIFGNPGSRDRKNRFAYIQLKATVLHPVVYNMLKTSSESISRILDNKAKYRLSNGIYIEDANGETGVAFIIKTLPHIDISSICKKEKVDVAQYLEKNKDLILIDKFIVIPAGYRDIDITKRDGIQVSSELNNLYKDVLYINSQLTGDETFDNILINKLQISLIKIIDWMQNGLKGKKGVMRGAMLKKRLDYSSRLVLVTNQDIPLGYAGIPWHSALAIYEPLFTNYVYKKDPVALQMIGEYLHKPQVDFNDLLKFIQDITIHPHIIPDELKNKLVDIVKAITADGVVMIKRDPVLSRNSWIAAQPMITEGRVVQLNALDLGPLGGDSIKGNIVIYEKFNDNYIPKIIDISKFNETYDCKFINEKTDETGKIYKYFQVNDEIYSPGINSHTAEITFNRINTWHIHENINLYSLNLSNPAGSNIYNYIAGERQSYYAFNKTTRNIEKINIQDLINNKSDYLLMQLKNCSWKVIDNVSNYLNISHINDSDFGWFIGSWIGDGYADYHNKDGLVAFCQYDKTVGNAWADIAEQITANQVKREYDQTNYINTNNEIHNKYIDKRSLIYRFYDKQINKTMLNTFGTYSYGKHLPEWILGSSNEFIFGIIAGLLDTDGYISLDRPYVSITTKSELLVNNIKNICDLRLNLKYSLKSFIKKNEKYYEIRLNVTFNDYPLFDNILDNMKHQLKKSKLNELLNDLPETKKYKYIPKEEVDKQLYGLERKLYNKLQQTEITTKQIKLDINNITDQFIKTLLSYQEENKIAFIPCDNLKIEKIEDSIGYDLTIDQDQKSFLHESGIITANCDGYCFCDSCH